MGSKSTLMWSIKEFVSMSRSRQLNEFDVNIGVSGKRGSGKSTLINKVLFRFKNFKPKKHQVYSRDDVINLLKNQKFGFCWDDEAINSGYKRNFQNVEQQDLIKIVTAYRDNFNIYISAIPFFYSLDKDLRELIFVHIHIIKRGLAVIFIQLQDNIHQADPWDTKNNARREEKWQLKKTKNPDFKFPYHKLSTFAGYLRFEDLTKNQRERYLQIKEEKRKSAFNTKGEQAAENSLDVVDRLYNQLMEGKLSREGLMQVCLLEKRKFTTVSSLLNKRLLDNGETDTLSKLLTKSQIEVRKEKKKLGKKERDRIYYLKHKKEIITQQRKYNEEKRLKKLEGKKQLQLNKELTITPT